ncbi:MAG: 4Fe-4S dicluster domain-containing protein [Chloroflexi bacterium]|nr:4Fe-4S dicluster domain-containing protein [Chloroflexota bacterium]
MRVYKISKQDEKKLFKVLEKFGEVWLPVKKGGKCTFSRIYSEDRLTFSQTEICNRPLLPLKKLLLPPEFNTLDFNAERYNRAEQNVPSRVVVGSHACDIHGVNILDKFYTTDFIDPFYRERRKKTIIIGTSCEPDEYCFCNKTNTNIIEEGYDLFFNDLGHYYLVWVGSSKGDDIIREGDDLFDENITDKIIGDFINWRKVNENFFTNDIDFYGVTDLMELKYNDNELWEYFGDKCLSCGQCTMVCPTCTCFNVIDDLEVNKNEGHRRRYWDSCMFKDYSMVAGGHNFRKTRAERLKLWYTHKLKAFIGQFGNPSCVGCGRCIVTCPVDINVYNVVSRLKGQEKELIRK